ncbi:MAG TPA: lysine--tRNA ligase [Candidatus Sulfotelmatobacter sp.]|jgi:lysyl-tRNA synthetase class 1|nr:lysine--tRNA ligase [Candidatus Sulfotelmatobacter sp.]
MFWADKVAQDIITSGRSKPYWVDDMKTPSGFAHVGSLMGPIIHSMIFRALQDAGKEATYTFVINDFDPADDLLPEIKGTHEKYLGMPLKLAPSPEQKFESMADLFSNDFINAIRNLGVEATILSSWELYHEGKFDGVIREALDNAETIQDIYHKVSGSKKKEAGWLPFQVICENCRKLGTTKVFAWDGEKVSYTCEPHLVKWAQGCGYKGKVSPFGGTGKLPWKVDWGAHWKVIGITIEGAGKDHASAGGSYDIAMTICKEVFHYDPPFKLPYEFILIGGKKMSSSKGLGLKAHDLVKILPPSIGRFLFARSGIKSQSNFDPMDKNAIPSLFDDYQKAADAYFDNGENDLARAFELSQVGELKKPPAIRFSVLTQWIQMPDMQEQIKKEGLEEWAKYAKLWIEEYAPESVKFLVQKELPEAAKNLSEKQKELLQKTASEVDASEDAEALQTRIYTIGKEIGLNGKETFAAIYKVLIGKDHGPKAAWLILSLEKKFVKERFEEAIKVTDGSKSEKPEANKTKFNKPEFFSIASEVAKHYPSISIGIAVIKDVTITKANPDLEKEKLKVLDSLTGLTTEKLGEFSEIISYRKLYRTMGIDWHSRRPSPEALLRRIVLNKGLYTINTCVDAYNLIVMKNRISVGAFDLDAIDFPTELRFAKEGEEILLLGDSEQTTYKKTELAYCDKHGGYNIDFNFRDAQRTAVKESTTNLYLNVDGIYDITPQQVEKTLQESCDMIMKYCGGKLEFFGIATA